MSRPNSSLQRSLTLTEELERLEQSITLTLQEIDHNFSRAHRIVTSSILPVVEQYAEHSREVWEGSKFWKQFFESSANVSLSGYEEQSQSESGQNTTLTEDSTAIETQTTTQETQEEEESESYATPSSEHLDLLPRDEDPDLSSLSLSHSTPRPPAHSKKSTSDITSPSQEEPQPRGDNEEGSSSATFLSRLRDAPPTTPRKGPQDPDETVTPGPSRTIPTTSKKEDKNAGPVLHRVLDKTYRIQATPLAKEHSKPSHHWDDSPISSPEPEAPQLHSELFSPAVIKQTTGRTPKPNRPTSPPKPGFSVLSPAKAKPKAATGPKLSAWDSDEDQDDEGGESTAMFGRSPPKTMGFHVPQSRLMKTPAKDASKRIVSDLLHTAGGTSDLTDEFDAPSPSMIPHVSKPDDDQPFETPPRR